MATHTTASKTKHRSATSTFIMGASYEAPTEEVLPPFTHLAMVGASAVFNWHAGQQFSPHQVPKKLISPFSYSRRRYRVLTEAAVEKHAAGAEYRHCNSRAQ